MLRTASAAVAWRGLDGSCLWSKYFTEIRFASMAAVKMLKLHHRCSPLNSYQTSHRKKRARSIYFIFERGGLWQMPDVLAKWNMLALTTIFAQDLFLSLGFLSSIRSNTTQTAATARRQWSCPCSYSNRLETTYTYLHTRSPWVQQSQH